MDWNEIEGKWEQFGGKVKEKWGKLTDDDVMVIKGKKDQLIGKLKERYGYAKDKAETEIASFMTACKSCSSDKSTDKSSNSQSKCC